MTPFRGTNRITSPYGWRTYKNSAGVTIREHHNGIDVVPTRYAGEEDLAGTAWDFREVTGGKVVAVSAGWNAGRGTLIKVQTAQGVIEFYQHCAAVYVKVGQQVPQGTVLAAPGPPATSPVRTCILRCRSTAARSSRPLGWACPTRAGRMTVTTRWTSLPKPSRSSRP